MSKFWVISAVGVVTVGVALCRVHSIIEVELLVPNERPACLVNLFDTLYLEAG